MSQDQQRPRPLNQVDRAAFREMCRVFSKREIEPRWKQADEDKQFPRAFYEAAAKAGLIGITASEDVGGAALGAYEEAIAMEELARVNPNLAVSVLVQNVAGSILYEYGQVGKPAEFGKNRTLRFYRYRHRDGGRCCADG
jgi:alkylation response protein AidB-like acyl-CoA dehydrogenase